MMVTRAATDAFRISGRDFEPAYMTLYRSGKLQRRAQAALERLADCHVCPRNCGVDRLANKTAACKSGRYALVGSHFPHFGEEDCLRGWNGSGTIFFSWCNLRCVFCQNFDVSQDGAGVEARPERLAQMMLALQEQGCHNINFVTPEHVVPQLLEALPLAVERGLRLPIVYNTSAYDSLDSLHLMEGIVDIYMPDFKFWDPGTARSLARAADYPERAREAIAEMHRQVGVLKVGPDGLARRGLLVRHLVMPGQESEAAAIFSWLVTELSPDTYVNVMGQYRPQFKVTEKPDRYRDINRRSQPDEMAAAFAAARRAGLWRFDERVLPW